MTHSPLLIIHISSALVALCAGWTALFLRKGSRRHGVVGTVFFVTMVSMCASALIMATMKQQASNVLGGTLTLYLAGTAWLTVKRREGETGRLELGAMLLAFAFGVAAFAMGWQATHSAGSPKNGVPTPVYFIFGTVALLSGAGDARMLLRGGVFGGPRIARHLWRMCTALLIATLSALAGKRAEILPETIRNAHVFGVPVLFLPMFLLIGLMIFWLVRVRFGKRYKRRPAVPRIKATPANSLA